MTSVKIIVACRLSFQIGCISSLVKQKENLTLQQKGTHKGLIPCTSSIALCVCVANVNCEFLVQINLKNALKGTFSTLGIGKLL